MTEIKSNTIKIDGRPFLIGEKSIDYMTVTPINFVQFVEAASKTNALGVEGNAQWQLHNRRARMLTQVKCFTKSGEVVKLTEQAITQMPIPYAKKLIDALGEDQGTPGKIVGTGDGVSSSLLYELGTPITMKSGAEDIVIKELEFSANTFGDVEEIMAEPMFADQALAMIRLLAKPVGLEINLQSLPSWAMDQITMADGHTIMEEVRPRFLE